MLRRAPPLVEPCLEQRATEARNQPTYVVKSRKPSINTDCRTVLPAPIVFQQSPVGLVAFRQIVGLMGKDLPRAHLFRPGRSVHLTPRRLVIWRPYRIMIIPGVLTASYRAWIRRPWDRNTQVHAIAKRAQLILLGLRNVMMHQLRASKFFHYPAHKRTTGCQTFKLCRCRISLWAALQSLRWHRGPQRPQRTAAHVCHPAGGTPCSSPRMTQQFQIAP